jgi:hypothetical protein
MNPCPTTRRTNKEVMGILYFFTGFVLCYLNLEVVDDVALGAA